MLYAGTIDNITSEIFNEHSRLNRRIIEIYNFVGKWEEAKLQLFLFGGIRGQQSVLLVRVTRGSQSYRLLSFEYKRLIVI